MRNLLKHLSRAALTTANRLSLIIASLLRIVAPSDISTAYAINNTLPPTHRPCRDCNVLRMYTCVFKLARVRWHTRCTILEIAKTLRVSRNRDLTTYAQNI